MGIHIQDEETARVLRAFAERRGLDVSTAVKVAVEEAEAATKSNGATLAQKIEPILERARSRRKELGIPADAKFDLKAFRDEMWEGSD